MAIKNVTNDTQKREARYSFSKKVGLLSGLTVLLSLIIDFFTLRLDDTTNLSIIMGFVMLLIAILVMTPKIGNLLLEKINQKNQWVEVIDMIAFGSVMVFAIERIFLLAVKKGWENRKIVLFIIAVVIALIIVAFIKACSHKDAYNGGEE